MVGPRALHELVVVSHATKFTGFSSLCPAAVGAEQEAILGLFPLKGKDETLAPQAVSILSFVPFHCRQEAR